MRASDDSNVVPITTERAPPTVQPLSDDEVMQIRQFLAEFAIVRATCPMAVRALAKR